MKSSLSNCLPSAPETRSQLPKHDIQLNSIFRFTKTRTPLLCNCLLSSPETLSWQSTRQIQYIQRSNCALGQLIMRIFVVNESRVVCEQIYQAAKLGIRLNTTYKQSVCAQKRFLVPLLLLSGSISALKKIKTMICQHGSYG